MSLSSDVFGNVFSLGGGWGNFSGPGLFMTKAFVSAGVQAIVFGLVGATGSAMVFGTAALPFVISASAGFAVGAIGFYRDAVAKALLALERYPLILRLHLQSNFPRRRFHLWDSRRLQPQEFQGNWVLSSMLVTSWLSAAPALERVMQQEEDAAIASEAEKGARRK